MSKRGTAGMTPEVRNRVSRAGGLKVSQNSKHMAEIGRKGGLKVSANRKHMAEIGAVGGSRKKSDAWQRTDESES